MKYEKPQIELLSSASDAIRDLEKNVLFNPDSGMVFHTGTAYEADE